MAFAIFFSTTPVLAESNDLLFEHQARQIMDEAPVTLEEFLQMPLQTLFAWLCQGIEPAVRDIISSCKALLLYLLLAGLLTLCLPGLASYSLLELISSAGAFLLLCESTLATVQDFASRATGWQNWIVSFAPIYASLLAAGGNPTLAAVYNGFFLSALQLLSHLIQKILVPFISCYLAVTAAGTLSGMGELHSVCRLTGEGIKNITKFTAAAFAGLMGLQRTFGAAADSAALHVGQALSSTIPVVGQTLSSASSAIAAAAAVLNTGVGFAAIAIIAAEFFPFILHVVFQMAFLYLCRLLCRLFGLRLCEELLRCAGTALEVVCALAALYFFMILVATALMMRLGGA